MKKFTFANMNFSSLILLLILIFSLFFFNSSIFNAQAYAETIIIEPETVVESVVTGEGSDTITLKSGGKIENEGPDIVGIHSGGGDDEITIIKGGIIQINAPNNGIGVDVDAAAVGVSAGTGLDIITIGKADDQNPGTNIVTVLSDIEVTTTATAEQLEGTFVMNEGDLLDLGITANSAAIGVDTGDGGDSVSNAVNISATANSKTLGKKIEVNSTMPTVLDLGLEAQAQATGILSGAGDDSIINTISDLEPGSITAEANAWATEIDFSTNLVDTKGAVASASTSATAIGVDTGEGMDTIDNPGNIQANAYSETSIKQLILNSTGVVTAKTGLKAESVATGVSAGDAGDTITNQDGALIKASATSKMKSESDNLTLIDMTIVDPYLPESTVDTTTESRSTAVGLSGDMGDDSINNYGLIESEAISDLTSISVSVGAEGFPSSFTDPWPTQSLADASPTAEAAATGIQGGKGSDTITVGIADADGPKGTITATATATADGTSVNLSLPLLEKVVPIPSPALAMGGAGTTAKATATGIHGDEVSEPGAVDDSPDDVIESHGEVTATATATANATIASITLQGLPEPYGSPVNIIDLNAAVADGSTIANANAAGIDGGIGNDTITNHGPLTATATAITEGLDISGSIIGQVEKSSLAAGAALVRATNTATASAFGIAGGEDNDTITNEGALVATAIGDADNIAVAVEIQGYVEQSLGVGATVMDTSTSAEAFATGIAGDLLPVDGEVSGAGNDDIANRGTIDVDASATATGISVEVTGGFAKDAALIQANLMRSDVKAVAEATGIHGGGVSAIPGVPDTVEITNGATTDPYAIDVFADADATSTLVTVDLQGAVGGGSLLAAASLTQSNTTSEAIASGIRGAAEDDIESSGKIKAYADADTTSTKVDVQLKGAEKGLVAGVVLSDTDTTAKATAIGIETEYGINEIDNTSTIESIAEANSKSLSVIVNVSGTLQGIAANLSLTESQTTADAIAKGIAAGEGDDIITNGDELIPSPMDKITATATSTTKAVDVGVDASITVNGGMALGVMLGRAGTTANATATGIDAGQGSDTIDSYQAIEATATSSSTLDHAQVGISGSPKGLALEVVLAETNNEATATAIGVDGGAGDDTITSNATITTDATSKPDTLSITAAVAGAPISGSASFARAETIALATATGIHAGDGMDTITNSSEINGLSKAHATTDSIVGELGTLGAAILEASSNPTARFTGIDGGAGADTIRNEGQIDFTAQSTADVLGVSAGVGLLGFIKGDVSTTAKAFATGIHGDLIPEDDVSLIAGNDDITNTGSIITLANVTANGRSISGQLAGVAMADGTTTGEATAEGISGDGAQDTITNTGLLDITATSSVTGWAVAGELLGWSDTDLTTTATSHATGIEGGDDDDTINNTLPETNGNSTAADITPGTITVCAEATANGNVISGNLAGVTSGEAGTTSNATAKGVSGGAGADTINNKATIDVTATSSANGLGVAAGLLGWEQVDLTTTSNATATGIDGGDSGDTITNGVIGDTEASQGSIHVLAEAISDGKSISVALAGFTDADQALPGDATATGIIGDAGTDEILNYGLIDVTATAASKPASLSIAIFGYAKANAIAGPEATATGIDGGDGDDTITNAGTIRAGYVPEGSLAMATVSKTEGELKVTTAGTGGGYAMAEAALGTLATATGIFGGGGIDTIENTGTIEVGSGGEGASPMAKTTSEGLSVGIFGGAKVKSVVTAHAESTGIGGGDGDDSITNRSMGTNTGIITVNATSDAYVDDGAGSGFFSIQGADITATSHAIGMAGGNGSDTINNNNSEDGSARGTITVNATSVARNNGNSDSGFIISTSKASTQVNASAKGIQADADDETADPDLENDTVVNNGDITVQAMATGYASSDAYVFAGRAVAKGTAAATVDASGIDAGIGLNSITNNGSISASAIAMVRPYAKANTDISTNVAEAYGHSQASAFGISAGDGGNTVTNTEKGIITATAQAKTYDAQGYKVEARSDEESIAVAGAWDSEAEKWLPVTSDAAGISLGNGSDIVINDGIITATSATDAKAYAYSNSWPNYAQSHATAVGEATAGGVAAGDGDNRIENSGQIQVNAWGNAESIADSFSRDETATTEANAEVKASAIGVEGNGYILNVAAGSIEVKVRATTHAETGKNDNQAETATATADLTARATGIGTASDAIRAEPDRIRNDGSITVTALAGEDDNGGPEYIADATVDTNTTRNRAEARGASAVDAAGIRAGNNSAEITNTGDLNVLGRARAHLIANSDEDSDAFTGVDEDTAVIAEATGIQAGDGINTITNFGPITVTSEVTTYSIGRASSTVFTATATSKAGASTDATGIMVGEGDNTIENYGTLTVTAANTGTALSDYPSAHLDKAFAYAGAVDTTLTSDATGISVGEGANVIENHNSIIVSSTVDAEARAYANTTTTTTKAEAHAGGDAKAIGIFAGNGQNIIKNYGDMTVSATADAYAKGDADEYGYACIGYESIGSGSVPGIIAQAIGISVGHGINEIINYGTLEVNSTATANSIAVGDEATIAIANSYAAATGIHTGDGMNIVSNVGTINVAADGKDASAIGIQTGDGDDTIANYGTISATNIKSGVSSLGVAIISGAGSDQVFLMNASESNGKINLGDGDDRLTLLGTPLVAGDVTGAVGIDTLIFDGPGSIDCNLMAFENAVKHGAGAYSVASLPTMERIEINQGTLQVKDDYQFLKEGIFLSTVYVDGTYGQFLVDGEAGLDGQMKIVRSGGLYRDGVTYDVLKATKDIKAGTMFNDVQLPEDTPLLKFKSEQLADIVRVEADVESFTVVAANTNQMAVAKYLDKISPNASGDLFQVLGNVQALSNAQFQTAFASLSPDSYDNATKVTYDITRLYTESLHQRMHGLRSNLVSPSTVTQTRSNKNSILLAYNGPESSIGQLLSDKQRVEKQNRTGIWAQIFGQWGDQDEEDGFTGFDYSIGGITLGFDYLLTDSLIAGLSFDYADTNIDLDKDSGNGDIESLGGSIYGTYFNKHTYFEAALSYGRQSYDNNRNIVIGPLVRTAYSEHDGDVFSAFGAGGYNFQSKEWTIGPFGSLQYVYLDEDGFQEYGAGSISLRVDGRETESLVSNLGLRLARVFEFESGRLVPEVSLAWKYDFDIDDRNITTSFVGSPGASFTIEGQDIEDHSAKIGIGLTFVNNSNVSVSLNYNAELRKNYNSQGIIGYLRVTF